MLIPLGNQLFISFFDNGVLEIVIKDVGLLLIRRIVLIEDVAKEDDFKLIKVIGFSRVQKQYVWVWSFLCQPVKSLIRFVSDACLIESSVYASIGLRTYEWRPRTYLHAIWYFELLLK